MRSTEPIFGERLRIEAEEWEGRAGIPELLLRLAYVVDQDAARLRGASGHGAEILPITESRTPADQMLASLFEQVQEAIAAGRSVHFETTCEPEGRVTYYVTVAPVVHAAARPAAPDTRLLAEEIVGSLFVNGQGEQADRLVLVGAPPLERDLGGWTCEAAVSTVEKALRQEIRHL